MERVRALTNEDLPAVRALWQERFDDPKPFVDWFFSERFHPDASAGLFLDGRLVSAIQGCPMRLSLRGRAVRALMISGVSTAVGFEGRGYMHRVMEATLRLGRKKGCLVGFHRPEHFETYRSMSQLPFTDARFAVAPGGRETAFDDGVTPGELLQIYAAVGERYSGFVLRTEAEMARKLRDYASCGGRAITVRSGEKLTGYAVLLDDGTAPEVLALNEDGYCELLRRLPRGTEAKLPPDALDGGTVVPGNAIGAIDVPGLLRIFIGDPKVILSIEDPVLAENTGVWNGIGEPINGTPDYKLSSGELAAAIAGYRSIGGLFDGRACYCVDEY